MAPTLDPEGLKGGVVYHDGQFDDARLAISIAKTAVAQGAVLLNYFPVNGFLNTNKKIAGVRVRDHFTGKDYEVKSKVVVNATGVFTDHLMKMDEPGHQPVINPSQGIHLVVDKTFLPGDTAIMIPRTDDGRVLFAVPWHDKIVLGTTDTPVNDITDEPVPTEEEIEFILVHMARYLAQDPGRKDVRSMFAGLRPLIKGKSKKTAALSRDHLVMISDSGLITITGGKWTTYRKMAEDVIDLAIAKYQLNKNPCITKDLALNRQESGISTASITSLNEEEIIKLIKSAVEEEMCMTVEDFLSRRTRQLLLDAREAVRACPLIAKLMALQMKKDDNWIQNEINNFKEIAVHYLPIGNRQ